MPSSTWTTSSFSVNSGEAMRMQMEQYAKYVQQSRQAHIYPPYRAYGTHRLDMWTNEDGESILIVELTTKQLEYYLGRLSKYDSCGGQKHKIVSLERILSERLSDATL